MSSSAITTGRWPPRWRSPFCCCWSVPSPSTSTTTCASSRRDPYHGAPLIGGPALGAALRHRGAVRTDPGADRFLLQRFAAGERVGRLFDRVVRAAAAQPPTARGRAAVARSGGGRLPRRHV